MASPVSSSRVQSAIAKCGVFWQLWPQFDVTGGERRQVGLEVELIGSHTPDLNHVDPACPMCHHVRSVLLGVADLLHKNGVFSRDSLTYDIDSHSNSILCLPALGNRSAVWVSITISWGRADGYKFETDLLSDIKASLANWGIHQR